MPFYSQGPAKIKPSKLKRQQNSIQLVKGNFQNSFKSKPCVVQVYSLSFLELVKTMVYLKKSYKKNSFNVYVISAFIILVAIFSRDYIQGFFNLDWGGAQVLPTVLRLKGYLLEDFFANSSLNSPYIVSASFLSFIFHGSQEEIVLQYSIFSSIFDITLILATAHVLCKLSISFCYRYISKQIGYETHTKYMIFIFFCIFLTFGGHGFFPYFWPESGGWGAPIRNMVTAFGFSWLLTCFLISTCITMSLVDKKGWKLNLSIVAFLALLASLFHPVIPLIGFLIILFHSLMMKYDVRKMGLLFLSVSIPWSVSIFAILLLFGAESISAKDLFTIYVEERHPHHYLPSYYYKTLLTLLPTFLICLVVISKIFNVSLKEKTFVITGILALALLPNLLQYLFVEVLHVSYFIKLGPSRLVIAYNMIVFSIIGTFIGWILFLFNKNNDSILYFWVQKIENFVFAGRVATLAIIFSLPIVYFLIVGHINAHSKRLDNIIEYKIAEFIEKYNLDSYQIVDLTDRSMNLREKTGRSVYVDYYFPFSEKASLEWFERIKVIRELDECFKETPSILHCKPISDKLPSIVLVSLNKLDDNSMNFLFQDEMIYMTTLN